jgi:hypothetical protein
MQTFCINVLLLVFLTETLRTSDNSLWILFFNIRLYSLSWRYNCLQSWDLFLISCLIWNYLLSDLSILNRFQIPQIILTLQIWVELCFSFGKFLIGLLTLCFNFFLLDFVILIIVAIINSFINCFLL